MIVNVTNLDHKLTVDFVTFCCEQLNIKPKTIYVNGYNDMTDTLKGYCIDVEEDVFTVAVSIKDRNITEIYTTIAHEMVHVKQYMTQNLTRFLAGQDEVGYYTSWYEREAREKSFDFVKKFVDILLESV
jgi:uncharacterized protein YjaZ